MSKLHAFAVTMTFAVVVAHASPAAAVQSDPLKAVLVGDSYSAGNGAGDYYGPKDCYRSTSNWAERYMDTLRVIRNVTFINRACSGGVLTNLTNRRRMDEKLVPVFVDGVVDKDDPRARAALDDRGDCTSRYRDDESYDIEPLYATGFGGGTEVGFECTRYMEPQSSAVGRDTDLVLFTIGGNDVSFSEIVKQCFAVFIRDPGDCRDNISRAQDDIAGVGDRIETFLRDIKAKMRPDAKIMLVTYPYLEKNPDFELRGGFLFTDVYDVGREIRELGDLGDEAQRGAVDAVNAEAGPRVGLLEELKPHFSGHEPDGRTCCRNDDRWVHEFDTFTPMEWYHFNPTGHEEVARLLSRRPDIGVGSAPLGEGGSVDIAFVIDTTGSMGSAIGSVKAAAVDLVNAVQARTASARFALVDYRDFPERTGTPEDYPAKLQQDFTTSTDTINSAIQALALGDGGDFPETMFSGINRALDLSWRPGVKKLVIVLADAPPLTPEPFTGTTAQDIVQRALAIDPVEAQFVDISGYSAGSAEVQDIAARTNGAIHSSAPSQAAAEIAEVIDSSLDRPYAWAGGPYVAKVGETVTLDGRGSYGVAADIVKWEWDVGADGTYEYASDQPLAQHTYGAPFEGLVALRVTDADDKTGLATVVGHASADGDEIADAADNCPAVDNRDQEDYDKDGTGDACDATPGYPTQDQEGVADGLASAAGAGPAGPGAGAAPPPPPAAGGGGVQPPGAARRADVLIGKPRLSRDGRRLSVRIACTRATGTCAGTLQAKLVESRFRAGYRVAASRGRQLTLSVPARARRSFERGGPPLTVLLTATARDGRKATRTARLPRRPGVR